jgi:hypothetical protein
MSEINRCLILPLQSKSEIQCGEEGWISQTLTRDFYPGRFYISRQEKTEAGDWTILTVKVDDQFIVSDSMPGDRFSMQAMGTVSEWPKMCRGQTVAMKVRNNSQFGSIFSGGVIGHPERAA